MRKARLCYQMPPTLSETLKNAIKEASRSKSYRETNGNSQLPPLQELLESVSCSSEQKTEWEEFCKNRQAMKPMIHPTDALRLTGETEEQYQQRTQELPQVTRQHAARLKIKRIKL